MLRTSAVTRLGWLQGVAIAALALGSLLALAGCPTVDLGEVPPDPNVCRPDRGYYEEMIWPNYLAPAAPAKSCVAQAGCHASNNGRSALRLETSDPIDHSLNYTAVTRFLNCNTPEASRLLTKPLSTEAPHGGDDVLFPGDPEIAVFLGWFP